MMIAFIGWVAVPLLVAGAGLILSASRRGHVESASIGGIMTGLSAAILSVQFFYLLEFGEAGSYLVYHGSVLTEMLLGMGIAIGGALIVLSIVGWARHRLFWRTASSAQEKS